MRSAPSPAKAVVAAPVKGSVEPSRTSGGSVTIRAFGATAWTVTVNVPVVACPWPSSAVMVTLCSGASSDAARVHDHVPAPVLVTAPLDADSATVSPSGSANVPVLVGAVPSLTLTAAVSAATEGAELLLAATQVLKAKSSPHWLPVSHVEPT